MRNPYQTYQKQSVSTMTQGEMLTMLYDGLIKHISFGQKALEEKNIENANNSLQKAQKILYYLRGGLDFKYEISNQLDALYDYFLSVCTQANVKKDPAGLADVIEMVADLRDTYIKADRQVRAGGTAAQVSAQPGATEAVG